MAMTCGIEGKGSAENPQAVPTSSTGKYSSPSRKTDLKLKNLEQLRLLKQLLDNGVLTPLEYSEQKNIILPTLSKLQGCI